LPAITNIRLAGLFGLSTVLPPYASRKLDPSGQAPISINTATDLGLPGFLETAILAIAGHRAEATWRYR